MNKKIMLTGASGFIGHALQEYLEKKKYQVLGLSSKTCDVTKKEELERIDYEQVRHIVHLAGRTFVPASWEDPASFIETNTGGTLNVLEICRKHNIPLTYISAYIYGMPEKNPICETDRVNPNNPYAKSKYMAEELCEFYAKQFGVKVTIIRPFNVYGIGQKENFLIPQIIRHALKEESIRVMDLNPMRDYIYLTDLLEAICTTLEKVQDYDVFNIGSGVSFSVKEAIDLVQEIAGTKKPVLCEQVTRKNEMNNVIADISHAKEILGWKPSHSFREGLKEIIEEKIHDKT